MAKAKSNNKRIIRKLIMWAVLLTVGIPNIILGEPGIKVVGLVFTVAVIWWDIVASRKEADATHVPKQNKSDTAYKKYAELISAESAYVAKYLADEYKQQDANNKVNRENKAMLVVALLCAHMTYRALAMNKDALDVEKTDKLLDYITIAMSEDGQYKKVRSGVDEHFLEYSKIWSSMPISAGKDLSGTLLWESSKHLYKVITSKPLEDAFIASDITSKLSKAIRNIHMIDNVKSL